MGKLIDLINPYKWVAAAVMVALLCAAGYWAYDAIGDQREAEVVARFEKRDAQAVEAQKTTNVTATKSLVADVTEAKVIYQTQIKEVVKYVESKKGAITCPADADFISLYNAASRGAD